MREGGVAEGNARAEAANKGKDDGMAELASARAWVTGN